MNIEQEYQKAVSNFQLAKDALSSALTEEEVSNANDYLNISRSELIKVYSEYQMYLTKIPQYITPGLHISIEFNKLLTENLNDFNPTFQNGKSAGALLNCLLTSALNKGFEDGVDTLTITTEGLKQEAADKLAQLNSEFGLIFV